MGGIPPGLAHPQPKAVSSANERSRSSTGPADSRCALCGAGSAFVRYDFGAHRILRCAGCTFMWLDPQPSAAELHEVYGSDYYRNEQFFDASGETIYGYHDYLSERFVKQQDLQRVVDRITALLDGSGGGGDGQAATGADGPAAAGGNGRDAPVRERRFLDVGCGLGYLLDVAHDRGFAVGGIDYNRSAVDWIAGKYTFSAVCGDFMAYDGEPCDAVTMLDVIEHLPQPFDALAKAASLTRPGGIFVVSTMDSDSFVSRLLGRRLEDFRRTREHLFFFNRRTLRAGLEQAGFEVLRIDTYGLTIRLDALMQRARLALPGVGAMLERLVRWAGLSRQQIHFDPRTKMIVYARRTEAA